MQQLLCIRNSADLRALIGAVPYLQELLGTDPAALSDHDNGWKLLIGMRPISFTGAELEYIDFGHGTSAAWLPLVR